MFLFTDEDPTSLVLTSTIDLQSIGSGTSQKEVINLILALLTNVLLASLLVLIAF